MRQLDPEKLAHELSERGKDWAEKDAAYYALEEAKHSILSQCKAELNDQDQSEAAKEVAARRSPKFLEHLTATAAARAAMNKAKVNYTTFQAYLELIRSREATNREEMKLR
ncbi:MAG TPA: hypothetical protein VIY48_11460 [Candidatus Paceibacterota bacterium]